MSQNIFECDNNLHLARNIFKFIIKEIDGNVFKSIMISGGDSLNQFYKILTKKKVDLSHISFILSDERLSEDFKKYSNAYKISKNLISKVEKNRNPKFICPQFTSKDSYTDIVKDFKFKIPDLLDIAVLGVGEDGHIASIFPNNNSELIYESQPLIISTNKNEEFKRISFNLESICKIPRIIFVITGKNKGELILNLLGKKNKLKNTPFFNVLQKSNSKINILYNKKLITEL